MPHSNISKQRLWQKFVSWRQELNQIFGEADKLFEIRSLELNPVFIYSIHT